ncbi:MAG TPA: homoserine kinase [Polyangia bacterium]|jgi:homoserine kinase type II|nr:homoserine kinase [Polyangia bacterium]
MASFRSLSADDVGAILRAFGAPAYRAHRAIAVGTINTNLRVETADGPRFLRVNEGKSEADVAREAAIVAHTAARGVPTPAPARAPGGLPYVRFSDAFVSLFPWLPGRTLARAEVGPAHARQVGAALARLHLAGQGFPDHRPGRYEPPEIDRRLAVATAAAASHPELQPAVATLAPELAALRRERHAELPLGLIHADLFIDNVLFDTPDLADAGIAPTGDLVALLDFEQASWGCFAYDLAVTLLAFAFGRDDFRPDVVRALVDGYAGVRAPTAAERAALGPELRFAACRFAVTRITDVHLRRGQGAPPGKDFARYLARLAQVKRHLAAGDGLLEI